MKAVLVRSQKQVYTELVERFPLLPIESEGKLVKAQKIVDSLVDRFDELGVRERGYLKVLGNLIHEYEEEVHPVRPLPPNEMLRQMIENRQVSQREVSQGTGIPTSTISDLISGKRGFTFDHVFRLSDYFHTSPAVFYQVVRSK